MTASTTIVDPRLMKAYRIAQTAGQWLKCRDNQGRPVAFAVPSSKGDGRYYLATTRVCECEDYQRRQQPCKHVMAIRLHVERQRVEKEQKGVA